MNLTQLLFEVGELRSPTGDALRTNVKAMLNRAQKSMCERRSWSFMRDRIQVTIPAGQTYVGLPGEFKSLCEERWPVAYSGTDNQRIPVTVSSRSEIENLTYTPGVSSLATGNLPIYYCFVEQTGPGGDWTFNIPSLYTPTEDVIFTISAYLYPQDLASGVDHNNLTDHGDLGDALINLTKAMCYMATDPLDPRAQACLAEYERRFKIATYSDETRKLGGRATRW
jgi:hypothetical protein